MKILLDENLPKQLKADFGSSYHVKTVRDMGWLGKKNGELLGLIVFTGFDFFVTIKEPTINFMPDEIRLCEGEVYLLKPGLNLNDRVL